MPLAKFFYGNTHKWYFRSAAAVTVATYVTFVAAYFDDKRRWILYLIAFGVVTGVYWLLYAPAKWVQADNLQSESDFVNRNNRSRLLVDQGGGTYQYAEELLNYKVQKALHNGTVPDPPYVPAEVRVLHFYLLDEGRWSERGPYGHTKQWRPPGFWRGKKEFGTFRDAIHREIADKRTGLPLSTRLGAAHRDHWGYQVGELAKAMLYLDDHSPRWRKRAQRWDDGGWARIVLRKSRTLVSRTFGRSPRDA